jgi:hypothetical protein
MGNGTTTAELSAWDDNKKIDSKKRRKRRNEIVDVKEECFESIRGNHREPASRL